MRWRVAGVALVLAGAAFVGFNPNRWDVVLFDVPFRLDHGIHVRDVIGMLSICAGIALLWFAPPRV